MTIQELESQFTSGVYTKRPIALVRGRGARVWDSDGNEYIDCVGGQGSVNVGHANPVVAEAIAKQAQTLITCPEMFYNDRRAELEQKAHLDHGDAARVPVQLRHGGGRSGDQVCAIGDEAHGHRRGDARLSRAHVRGVVGDVGEEIPRTVRAAGAGFQSHLLQRCCGTR